jgi:hypothetical protein
VISLNDLVIAAGDKADVHPGEVLDAMKAICGHAVRQAPAAKAASA